MEEKNRTLDARPLPMSPLPEETDDAEGLVIDEPTDDGERMHGAWASDPAAAAAAEAPARFASASAAAAVLYEDDEDLEDGDLRSAEGLDATVLSIDPGLRNMGCVLMLARHPHTILRAEVYDINANTDDSASLAFRVHRFLHSSGFFTPQLEAVVVERQMAAGVRGRGGATATYAIPDLIEMHLLERHPGVTFQRIHRATVLAALRSSEDLQLHHEQAGYAPVRHRRSSVGRITKAHSCKAITGYGTILDFISRQPFLSANIRDGSTKQHLADALLQAAHYFYATCDACARTPALLWPCDSPEWLPYRAIFSDTNSAGAADTEDLPRDSA